MFMQTANKFAQEVLGDWQSAGILAMHSGLPFWVSTGQDLANTDWSFEPAQEGPKILIISGAAAGTV